MDLTIRDWMVIVGVLLIMAVFMDAWRRIYREKRAMVRISLVDPDALPSQAEDDLTHLRELPNGGGRVVERGDLIRVGRAQRQAQADAVGQHFGTESGKHDPGKKTSGRKAPGKNRPLRDDDELVAGMSSITPGDELENLDWLDRLDSEESQSQGGGAALAAGKLPRIEEPEVFMLNVVARSPQKFRGDDILQFLLACDLRFGDMNFFHRHEYEAGRGAIQFSVANMMQPGVFDIDNMAEMLTPGLVFFLTLPGPDNMMQAFDYMLETAQAVARNLGADVLDESRSVLTRQTIEHCRQQIRDRERRLLAKAR